MSSKKNNNKRGITRRDFVKWSAAAGAAAKAVDWAKVGPSFAAPTVAKTYRNICPYCSVACGVKVDVDDANHADGTILDIYGDEGNVINRGSLCSKGSALYQLVNSPARETDPKIKTGGKWYKHHLGAEAGWKAIFGVDDWSDTYYKDKVYMPDWEEDGASGIVGTGTVDTIPQQLTDAAKDYTSTTNGPDTVAFWGSSHQTNEECYLYRKLLTLYGTHNIEHQARI